ncbi:MAG: hypothetical protein ACHREM_12475 [Polyangiales bacterium]
MTTVLDTHFARTKHLLDETRATLGRHPGKLPLDVQQEFERFCDAEREIDHWRGTLGARAAARALMTGLEREVDVTNNTVMLNGNAVGARDARVLVVQAYVGATWALSDSITRSVGRVLCVAEPGRNDATPAQLMTDFLGRSSPKRSAGLSHSMRLLFGWPVGISYALRNHFIHDGGHLNGYDFFAGPMASAAFEIATPAWSQIENRATSTYDVASTMIRPGVAWPAPPTADLRTVLDVCERELDEALGVLLVSSSQSVRAHLALLLGE